jgi:hypothetical protein
LTANLPHSDAVSLGLQIESKSRCFKLLQVAYTDIDQLEKVVHILAHGDILSENTRELTEVNFLRIFRLAQLVIEYLLHVQDTLASERHLLLAFECALAHLSL